MRRSPALGADAALKEQPPLKVRRVAAHDEESPRLPPTPPDVVYPPLPPPQSDRTPSYAVCHLSIAAAATTARVASEFPLVRRTPAHATPHLPRISDFDEGGISTSTLHCIAELYAQAAYIRAFQANKKQLEAPFPRRPSLFAAPPWNVAGRTVALQQPQRLKLIALGHICVVLARRLLCFDGRCAVRQPLEHATSLLARRHVMPFFLLPSPIARLPAHEVNILSVAFHPQLQLMATGSHDKTAKLWLLDMSSRSITHTATLQGHSDWVWCVTFHSRLPLLATSSRDNTAKLWVISDDCTATCSATLRGHSSWVCCVVFHATLPFLATGSNDGHAKLWMLEQDSAGTYGATCTGSVYAHSSIVISVAFHPVLSLLATGGDNNAKIWSFSSGGTAIECVATLVGHEDWVWCVAFHPVLPLLASGSEDGTAMLWLLNPEATQLNQTSVIRSAVLKGHGRGVNTVAFHSSLPLLATGSGDSTVKLWLVNSDGASAVCTSTLKGQGESVSCAAFHPHLPLLATGARDGTVILWR
jgi:WD40 repeat protein